jgi:hypothetical protein
MLAVRRILLLIALLTFAVDTTFGDPIASLSNPHDAVEYSSTPIPAGDGGSGSDSGMHTCNDICHFAYHFLGYVIAAQSLALPADAGRPEFPAGVILHSVEPGFPKRPPRHSSLV